ncbi:MAG: T9SS type A sorting domain-containing protein, partial [Bacteroidota bacterium]
ANDLIAEADGSLVIASARGYLEETNPYVRYAVWNRGLIFKLNAQRQVEWETELDWNGFAFFGFTRIVKALDESGYVAAGNVGFPDTEPSGRLGYLAKVSPTGDSLWSRRLFYYDPADSLQYNHAIHDLKATPDGGYFMSGQTKEPNGLTSPSQRAWFLKVDSEGCLVPNCGLVDAVEPTAEGPALLLYPNPAQETLNVYLGDAGSEQWTLQIIDAQGRQVGRYAAPIGHTTYLLPVADLAAGVYYLRVSDARERTGKTYAWVKG